MDELLRIFVLGVEWFALWLERSPLHVAWPVLFVALSQAFLSVVNVLQWYARGMLLRISCDYPLTTSKRSSPCKNPTLGEWHRCHQHRHRWQRLTDGHVVDPDLPRWLRITVEYYAALLLFLAVSITHNGVWGERQNRMLVPRDDWLRLAPWHHRPLPGRHRGGDPFPHRVGRPWPAHPRRRP
jgi:hypothetical protein